MTQLQQALENVETFEELETVYENLNELGEIIGLSVIEDLFQKDRKLLFEWLHDWDATHNEPARYGLKFELRPVAELEAA